CRQPGGMSSRSPCGVDASLRFTCAAYNDRMPKLAVVVLATACGRLGFDSPGDGASGDGGFTGNELYVKASNTGACDAFGRGVAVSADGTTIAIGAPGERSGATGVDGNQADNSQSASGAVYLFVRSGATWSQQAYVKASNTGAGDNFGE